MGGAPPVPSHACASSECPLDLWLLDIATDPTLINEIAREHRLSETEGPSTAPITPRDATRAMLRILLAGYIGTSEARRPFEIAEGGKPSLATRTNPPLQFSLAHGDTAAIIAVSFDGPIGVDLETPRHVRIAEHRRHALIAAAASLHPERPLPTTPEDACFLQAWTRLEALAKATGEGIGAVLERVRRDETPIARTTISNRPVHVRDVTVGLASPIYAAVAGTAASIAAARHLEALPVPLERSWLEHWLAGDGSRGGLEA